MVVINGYLGDQIPVLGIEDTKAAGGIPELYRIAEDLCIGVIHAQLLVDIAGQLEEGGFHMLTTQLRLR